MRHLSFRLTIVLIVGMSLFLNRWQAAVADGPSFRRDVLPILAQKCFACHGPDEKARQGGVRFDDRDSVTGTGDSGLHPVVAGQPDESAILQRIRSDDPDQRMPPLESGKEITDAEYSVLRQWIQDGAKFETHWAFEPVTRTSTPVVRDQAWVRNPIDAFILSRLERDGMMPSDSASPEVLLRRLSLDLTGLPPEIAEQDRLLADFKASQSEDSDEAYARWVDHFMASPHYGERMAVDWLDAARYADTNGYQVDRDRDMSAWRDWVINAFNSNMPFDEFTIHQIAGDLLPEAGEIEKIASGFHRNHMLNEEGGIIAEEFLVEACCDRVETTATVWLGQTFNCVRCHDHKFDPFTQKDFYSLYAFFNNVEEQGVGNYGANYRRSAPPFLLLPTAEQQARLKDLETRKSTVPAEEQKAVADQIAAIEQEISTVMIMQERKESRQTRILMRGDYSQPGAVVEAATPAVLPAMSDNAPRNRLGLAQWLVDRRNPLTARVTVNRIWQSIFGTGLVRTSEDFGSQGEYPSHPELLDWLAMELMDSGWDIQHLLKLILSSSTYRQASHVTPDRLERDPENRLLSRGPRFRLQSEFVRDQALGASGLLNQKIGGPSVKPYHPPGLYEQVTAGSTTNTYVQGGPDELFRRSMYTYWKRSVPHPAMLVFDAPFRETCTVRRTRTNTPLQALNLLNDPVYLEASRALALRMIQEGGSTSDEQIRRGFRRLLVREPSPEELSILNAAYYRNLRDFEADPDAAAALIRSEVVKFESETPMAVAAALTVVSSSLLNLDEAVMKE